MAFRASVAVQRIERSETELQTGTDAPPLAVRCTFAYTMTPERYQQIKKLFEAALQLGRTQRAEFLRYACKDDEELCAEVQRLLASDEQEPGFLDSQPMGSVSSLLRESTA